AGLRPDAPRRLHRVDHGHLQLHDLDALREPAHSQHHDEPELVDADRAGLPMRLENAMRFAAQRREGQAGQAIVVMVGAILLAVVMVATIVDGGNVLAQQRVTQNGADATAEAGAVLLAERLAGATEPSGGWDLNIAGRLAQTAAANNVTVEAAYYT